MVFGEGLSAEEASLKIADEAPAATEAEAGQAEEATEAGEPGSAE